MSFTIKNFSMRAFNNDVNNSGDPTDKYVAWAPYRNDVTGFIRSAAKAKPNAKSIIIFGAGECNDLDLKFLADAFEHIVLTDVDAQSIHDGIARQVLADSSAFEVLQIEYTGLESAGFFDTFSLLVSESAPEAQISSFIKNALQNVMSPNMSKLLGGEFDFVLSCPVYTQIVYTQAEVLLKILEQYSTYSPDDLASLKKTIYDSMPFLIKKYNDLLLSMANPDGLLMMLTDIIEALPSSDLVREISQLLSAKPLDTTKLEGFITAHGLPFGVMGKDDLLAKIAQQESAWSMWPFDERRTYLVSGVVGRKK